jgi:hypothetical protein
LIVCEFARKHVKRQRLITCEYEELGGDGSVTTRIPVYSAQYNYRVLDDAVYQHVSSGDLMKRLRSVPKSHALR